MPDVTGSCDILCEKRNVSKTFQEYRLAIMYLSIYSEFSAICDPLLAKNYSYRVNRKE
jgi:hypothetical protein